MIGCSSIAPVQTRGAYKQQTLKSRKRRLYLISLVFLCARLLSSCLSTTLIPHRFGSGSVDICERWVWVPAAVLVGALGPESVRIEASNATKLLSVG